MYAARARGERNQGLEVVVAKELDARGVLFFSLPAAARRASALDNLDEIRSGSVAVVSVLEDQGPGLGRPTADSVKLTGGWDFIPW